jgi:hypothetical protein
MYPTPFRDRLHRMADIYSHIAETDAGRAPASTLMDALTQRDKRSRAMICHSRLVQIR